NITEDAQVPAEGAQHPLVFFIAQSWLLDQVAWRQDLPNGALHLRKVFCAANRHVDTVELAKAMKGLLGGGDVDGQKLQRPGVGNPIDLEMAGRQGYRAMEC